MSSSKSKTTTSVDLGIGLSVKIPEKLTDRMACGIPFQDIVNNNGNSYEVNTVAMNMFTRLMNPLMDLRNEMFGINALAETMVFELNKNEQRTDRILHCQRYRKFESAIKWHNRITNRLKRGRTDFFNGDGNPWNKQ